MTIEVEFIYVEVMGEITFLRFNYLFKIPKDLHH